MSGKHPNDDLPIGCIHHQGLSRRKFLAGCAACAGAASLAAAPRWLDGAPGPGTPAGKIKIRVIYALHGPQQKDPDWPNKGFDFVPVMDRINAELINDSERKLYRGEDGLLREESNYSAVETLANLAIHKSALDAAMAVSLFVAHKYKS